MELRPAKLGLPPLTERVPPANEAICAVSWVPVPSIVRETSLRLFRLGLSIWPPCVA